jgi:hypothetical protein
MTTAFDAYRDAIAKMEAAEKRATDLVTFINAELEPLRHGWKHCYLAGVADTNAVPTSLVLGGTRQPVNVANVQTRWPILQLAMAEYTDAEAAAKQAHHAMPESEKRLLMPPPWERTRV